MAEEEEKKDEQKTTTDNNDKPEKADNSNSEVQGISPLEEARQLRDENKKLLESISEERKKIEKASGDMLIAGKSFAGSQPAQPREKTPQEIQEENKEYAEKALRGELNDK